MTGSRIHLLLATLMGASGVMLWAYAAHSTSGSSLVTAAQFLLIHAIAVVGLTACRKQGLLHNRSANLAMAGLILGCILFSGDLAARALLGGGLFPMAAPSGGILLIAGWLAAAISALVPQH
ncbi:MAG: DUF423 domain-containing protein [Beijerinckiaceae bacterium]